MNAPKRVGVVGGGRMGAGIAQEFLVLGADVVVVESDRPAAEAARERVLEGLEGAQRRGKLDDDPDKVAELQLGRKTGPGFHEWDR